MKGSAREVLRNAAFLLFIVVSVLIAARTISGRRMPDMRDATVKSLLFVFAASFVYVIVHFVAFPEIEERFFVGQYVLSLAVLFWLLSRNGVAHRGHRMVPVDRC